MRKNRFTEPQIIAVLRHAESGVALPELCRKHGISTASFYKCRSKYGGIDASMMSQMKSLEDENRRLKSMFADLNMKADLLKEALGKKMTPPAQRRELAEKAVATTRVSIALACRTFGVSKRCFRCSPKRDAENEFIADVLEGVTKAHRTWGVGLCLPQTCGMSRGTSGTMSAFIGSAAWKGHGD